MNFIETLLITDKINNLSLHNQRMNTTRNKHFNNCNELNLADFIKLIPNKRVRVLYNKEILNIEYFDLIPRKFDKLKVVNCDNIDYSFKYENRNALNQLKDNNFDEIIIIKNNFVTDTTISNLAFFNGKEWITPSTPLLKGTKREELLQNGFLKEKEIKVHELSNFKKIAMINAILGFYEVGDISCIQFEGK